MTIEEITDRIEKLSFQAWELNSLALAVHDAIMEGPNAASHFDGALSVLTSTAYKLDQEMKAFSHEMYEILRAGGKGQYKKSVNI